MIKIVLNFVVTIILALILSSFLPWWSVMTAALATSLFIPLKRAAVFFVPFIAILIFWSIYSFYLSSTNDFIMATRIATLLKIGNNPYLLILLTGTIGGVAAGVAAIFGRQLALFFESKN